MSSPKSLRFWFILHWFVDTCFAIPLLLAPVSTLALFGIQTDPLMPRLFAAALVAIGSISLLESHPSHSVYKVLLRIKLIFSGTALLGIGIASFSLGFLPAITLAASIYTLFLCAWGYYYTLYFKQRF